MKRNVATAGNLTCRLTGILAVIAQTAMTAHPARGDRPPGIGINSSGPFQLNRAGQYYFLTTNLTVSGNGNGLTITANNVTLDLNGYTIAGPGSPYAGGIGILVSGVSGVTIQNGAVKDFTENLDVRNSSACTIYAVNASNTPPYMDNYMTLNYRGLWGIVLGNTDNTHITHCTANYEQYKGIRVSAGTGNILLSNVVSSCGSAGLWLQGSNNNTLQGNTITGNTGSEGICMQASDGNTVRGNAITFNRFGISVGLNDQGGTQNLIESNTCNYNSAATGLSCGIVVWSGATNNNIRSNNAFNHGGYDLADGNALCGSNVWSSNSFGTRSQPCIQ